MMNLIRADLYAILRGKAIYITFAVMLLLHILVIGTRTAGGVNFGGAESMALDIPVFTFDGLGSVALLYTRMDNLAFYLLPLIIAASAPIFTYGTVKNDLAWGVSRTKLYLSKLSVAIGLCVFMMLFYMVIGVLFATALNGFGGPIPAGYLLSVFQTLGAQLFMMVALTCIGVFLVFTTKRTAIVTGVYIAFYFVPAMVIMLLMESGFNVARLLEFDVMLGINRLGFISQLETRSIITILSVGAAYILATTIGGIALFRRAEIK